MRRYSRHISLAEIGVAGQKKLRRARVAIVGIGGLGCPAAQYLAAAGVGTLGLMDGDSIDPTNLQRQVLFGDGDVGRSKAEVAAERLRSLNGSVEVRDHAEHLTRANALSLLAGYDLVLDGTDNFRAKYLVNDAAWMTGIPVVQGSVLRFEGRLSTFSREGPCYRCLFPEPPRPGLVQDCATAGVLGVIPGVIGALQAMEAIKLICGLDGTLVGRLLLMDGARMSFQAVQVERDPKCRLCGTGELRELVEYDEHCSSPAEGTLGRLSPSEVAGRLQHGCQLIDVREKWEWDIARIPGAVHIPVGELQGKSAQLDAGRETIVYCHLGVRSLVAAQGLILSGFSQVAHLEGGIDRWSVEVDRSIPRY